MSSRRLEDLHPEFMGKTLNFLHDCEVAELNVLVYCTYRSPEEQAVLFKKGRSDAEVLKGINRLKDLGMLDMVEILEQAEKPPGRKHVTNAPPGLSFHQYGLAFDGVPLVNGKCLWDTGLKSSQQIWSLYGLIAENSGLNWSGYWMGFKEYPHCQMPGELLKLIEKYSGKP